MMPDGAAQWLENMQTAGITPDVISYSCVIHAFGRTGKPSAAAAWFCKMEDAGLVPDIGAYNALIDAFNVGNQPEKAEAWLDRLEGIDSQRAPLFFDVLLLPGHADAAFHFEQRRPPIGENLKLELPQLRRRRTRQRSQRSDPRRLGRHASN